MLKKSKVNEYFLITPFSLQEAVQSSKIEGTQVTFDEVLEFDIDKNEKNNDAQEVLNYYDALNYGERALEKYPISTRLFKKLHEILMSNGVRGQNRAPGEYRSIQNFIGPEGCTLETAIFDLAILRANKRKMFESMLESINSSSTFSISDTE